MPIRRFSLLPNRFPIVSNISEYILGHCGPSKISAVWSLISSVTFPKAPHHLRRFRKSLNSGRAFLMLPWPRSCERPHSVKIGATKSFARIVWTWLLESLMVNGAASLGQSFHLLGWQLCSYLLQAHWPIDPVIDRRKFLDWDRDSWAQDLVSTWQSAGRPWANHPLSGLHFAIGGMRFPQKPLTHHLSSFSLEGGSYPFH